MPTNSRFAVAPSDINKNRSGFDMPYRHKTTGNFADIIPFFQCEVIPGDTISVTTRLFSRMSTPLYPVMDDAWINYYYFFIPNRLVWSHWAEFLGENKYSAWVSENEYIVPHADVVSSPGSVYDHLGVPTYTEEMLPSDFYGQLPSLDINFLLPRMYHLVYNEWFRNENTTDPILVNTGDDVSAEEVASFQTLCKAAKPFDAFTSALPSPQKGNAVDIPLSGTARVYTSEESQFYGNIVPMMFHTGGYGDDSSLVSSGSLGVSNNRVVNKDGTVFRVVDADQVLDTDSSGGVSIGGPVNLVADLSRASAATINQLRQAFQMQRLLELQARTGTRYTEIIKASFGVTSPDARLQRPEYLGGSKVQIQMQQVTQTSATSDESPLGKLGAFSKTVSANFDFNSSFTEHGYILGVAVARHQLTYSQGLARHWSRRSRYDYYWPTFANIGEQPIFRRELYANGRSENDDQVFGYQEAWFEYRHKPGECTAMFRPTVSGSLDEWHYGDYYTSPPLLSEGWMNASAVNVDRTLAVSSSLHDQLLFDFQIDINAARPMPLYSVPGLIDHF